MTEKMESKAEVYKRIIGNVAYSLSGSGHNSQVEQAMEEYKNSCIEDAIKEIEDRQSYWKEHGNYYICGGLQEAIEILKSKL